jgi:hypothetical protein
MPLPAHLERFFQINSAVRVALLCRELGVREGPRVWTYTRALRDALRYLAEQCGGDQAQLERGLEDQVAMLRDAVLRLPPPPPADADVESPSAPSPRTSRRHPPASGWHPTIGLSMEEKLEQARKPLRKLLQEDCVRLGLIDSRHATELVSRLAGRLRAEVEAELVADLHNHLDQQLELYMRKHRGGPWSSTQSQEKLRVEIASTTSVHAVVYLTRRLLEERREWEARMKRGRLRNLLGTWLRITPCDKG